MSAITGRAKKYDGSKIDYVLLFDWETGNCIGKAIPDASGLWSFPYSNTIKVGITYVADGCEPITHGAYDFVVSWSPKLIEPKLYLDTDSAEWSGGTGSDITAWHDLSGNQSDFLRTGSVTRTEDDGLSILSGNNCLYNNTDKAKRMLSGVGKAWLFMVVKPKIDNTTFFHVTDTSGQRYQARLAIQFLNNKFVSLSSKNSRTTANDNFSSSSTIAADSYYMILLEHEWSTGRVAWHINGAVDRDVASHLQGSSIGTTDSTEADNSVFLGQYASSDSSAAHEQKMLVLGTNETLTQDNIDKLFGYAAHKHGLTDKLPSGHPYKTVAPT